MRSKILLVDDEPTIVQVLAQVLEDNGAQVTRAQSAEDAHSICVENSYDLLLVDKNLPAQNGIDLAARLLKRGAVKNALMITGYPSVRSLIEACNAGILGYLIKPFAQLQVLLDEVQRILDKQAKSASRQVADDMLRPVLAQDIIAWLKADDKSQTKPWRIALDLHEAKLSLRSEQLVRRHGMQIVPVDKDPQIIIADQQASLSALLQQKSSCAGLYIGEGLSFDEVISLMHRGHVAISTEAMIPLPEKDGGQQ